MTTVLRRNRKGSNEEIIRLNAVGLSLSTIGEKLDCHPTCVTLRLKSLNIQPADTRRGFMDDVFRHLPDDHQSLVADILTDADTPDAPKNIKDYVKTLVEADVKRRVTEDAEKAERTRLGLLPILATFLALLVGYPLPPEVVVGPMPIGMINLDDDEHIMHHSDGQAFLISRNGVPRYA